MTGRGQVILWSSCEVSLTLKAQSSWTERPPTLLGPQAFLTQVAITLGGRWGSCLSAGRLCSCVWGIKTLGTLTGATYLRFQGAPGRNTGQCPISGAKVHRLSSLGENSL